MDASKLQTIELQGDPQNKLFDPAQIQNWLIVHLAETLQIDPAAINTKDPFDRYGLDSSSAVNLVGELEEWLGLELSPTLPYEYPTVERLVQYLTELHRQDVPQ